jgi:hypothetical protein
VGSFIRPGLPLLIQQVVRETIDQLVDIKVSQVMYKASRKVLHPQSIIAENIPPNTFRQNGDVWEVRFHDKEAFRLKLQNIDARRLAFLLSHPNEKFPVIELVFGVVREGYEATMTDLGEMDDEDSIRELWTRFQELQREIDKDKDCNASVDLAHSVEEQQKIMDRLLATHNRKGKLRTTGSPKERARKAFYNSIYRVRARIGKYDRKLAEYLQKYIHCGFHPHYESKELIQWETKQAYPD